MNDKIDSKTAITLLNALKSMQDDIRVLQDKREDSLWSEVIIPCNLNDVLNNFKKDELDLIRKNLAFKNLSSLKKQELATVLSGLIPINYKSVLYSLDKEGYDLIKSIVINSGVLVSEGLNTAKIQTLRGYGIIFTGLYNNQKVLFMPIELINAFNELDITVLEKTITRNTEWINITQGMMYYYGTLDAWRVIKNVEKLTKCKVDISEFVSVISFAIDYYRQIQFTDHGYKDKRVLDDRALIKEHNLKPDIDYYPFSKNQLINAGKGYYINDTPEMKAFIAFLQNSYDLSENDVNKIALDLTKMINTNSETMQMVEYMQSMFEIPSFQYLQVLTSKLMELYNNTRQWAIKGHTPNELFQEEKEYLKPLPSGPLNIPKSNKKVGRNEPCPCGSGKKYKKCCGG
ncbi:MAG TPA: zinc chelation protein SecC [Gallicola sp.]|jgi:hypothetical protein|nr:zinc chelation protein SecC [Gallicola sp.]